MGSGRLQGSARAGARHGIRLERQRHDRECSSICVRTSTCTKWISRASTTDATASSAAGSSRSSTRFAGCTRSGVWVEIVTLLVPGFNDSEARAARTDRRFSPASRGHPLARHGVSPGLQDDRRRPNTTAAMLLRAAADRPRGWPALRVCGQPAWPGRASWNTRTATAAANA